MIRAAIIAFFALLLMSRCASVKSYELGDGKYTFHQHDNPRVKVYIHMEDDSILIAPIDTADQRRLPITPQKDEMFTKKGVDIDALTSLFKYRPPVMGAPRRLTTSFNGGILLGYRIDRFKVRFNKTPFGMTKQFTHRGISLGGFGGVGSTPVGPWTTNYQTSDEYDGFVFTRGFALLGAVNSLTAGVSVGWDYLTDRDKNIWIYQNKPWFGMTLGLNIN